MSQIVDYGGPSPLSELVKFLREEIVLHPGSSKDELEKATAERFGLGVERSVYFGPHFAIRFSTANTLSFSNVVLSLSALKRYDNIPFIVCVVRKTGIDLLLANSTFLKKISHSSHELRMDNVKGSFLGHDILREYEGIKNVPEEFDRLFATHQEFTWEENLARLVESTNNIVPTGTRFIPTQPERDNILRAPEIAHFLSRHPEYLSVSIDLDEKVSKYRLDILKAATIDNINLRGNRIEQIITQVVEAHNLEDLNYSLKIGMIVMVDVKTKMLNLSSSPKGYNVDKVLKSLARGNTVFSFFFIGIDPLSESLYTRLVSIFDRTVLNVTKVMFHWAGRNSRGVTQLTGDLSFIFSPDFEENIDVQKAKQVLNELIDRPQVIASDLPQGQSTDIHSL
jgi:hypothetical protein